MSFDYINLAELVRTSATEHLPPARAKDQRLVLQSPARVFALADGPKLAMVVDNLISNAVKYTPPGGQILVRLQESPGLVTLAVEDTGIGIEREQLTGIFTKFGSGAGGGPAAPDSTGLGLYLAKHLVVLHNGDIKVTSTPGKGSVFSVCLPVTREVRAAS
jgi:signal transduction histidine kinase